MSDEKFNIVAAKLAAAKEYFIREINRDLFTPITAPPIPPPTRRERLAWRLARVRGYFATLWDAVRGRDPYDNNGGW